MKPLVRKTFKKYLWLHSGDLQISIEGRFEENNLGQEQTKNISITIQRENGSGNIKSIREQFAGHEQGISYWGWWRVWYEYDYDVQGRTLRVFDKILVFVEKM